MSRTFLLPAKDIESSHCLLSGHFLPGLHGIVACHQCTSPPTFWMSLPRSSPPYQMRHKIDALRRSCDASPRYFGVRRACSCSHGQCNPLAEWTSPQLPFSIFILQGLTMWQHRTLWEHKLEHRCFSLEGHGRFQFGIWQQRQGPGGQMPGQIVHGTKVAMLLEMQKYDEVRRYFKNLQSTSQ